MYWVSIILVIAVCTFWYESKVRRITRGAESRFSAACADAALERLQAYRHYKTYDAIKNGERGADEHGLTPIEELLPWEDDQYGYVYLGQPVHHLSMPLFSGVAAFAPAQLAPYQKALADRSRIISVTLAPTVVCCKTLPAGKPPGTVL